MDDFALGDCVFASWAGTEYPGQIVAVISVDPPLFLVHYIGWSDGFDEVFEPGPRLRRRPPPHEDPHPPVAVAPMLNPPHGHMGLAVGDRARCIWGSNYYDATVLEVIQIAGDEMGVVYRMRYTGWDASFDELVLPSRLVHHTGSVNLPTDYDQGAPVDVEWNGTWWPSQIIEKVAEQQYRISYEAYGPEWDETVPISRIAPRGVGASVPAPGADPDAVFVPGEAINIYWGRQWWPGRVVEVLYRVSYDGWSTAHNTNVTAKHITRRRGAGPVSGAAGQSVYEEGSAVMIEWNGGQFPGRVVAVLGDSRFRVSYDGYDEWEEDVGVARLMESVEDRSG